MRLVTTLSVAIATLLSAANSGLGQMPQGGASAWVSDSEINDDDGYESSGDYDGFGMSEGFPGGDCDEYCDDGGPAGLFGRGGKHGFGHGGNKKPCALYDLWNDVNGHRRVWVSADYLQAWTKGNLVPSLGLPGAGPFFGGQRVDTDSRSGARINFGYWLVDGEFYGVEGGYFGLEPTFSQLINVADPNQADGSITGITSSNVQSANATFRHLLWIDFTMGRRLDIIGGYRFFRIDDSVTLDSAELFDTDVFFGHDVFSARNEFHGGEIGLKFQQYHGRFSAELVGKIAFGNMRQQLYSNGSSTLTPITAPNPINRPGGLLTDPLSNIGTFRYDTFAILPEANANLRMDVTRNLRLTAGYTFIFTNKVQRSGDAIDQPFNQTQIDTGSLAGTGNPQISFRSSEWWMHAVSAGLEYRW